MNWCVRWGRWLGLAALLLAGGAGRAAAQSFGEKKAFDEALQSFSGGEWQRAEAELAEFTRTNPPTAKYYPDAVLLRAQALGHLTNHAAARELLMANLEVAGKLSDQYVYGMARAGAQMGEHARAAVGYAQMLRDFPNSPLAGDAIFQQAREYFELGDYGQTAALLAAPRGAFQTARAVNPTNRLAADGLLLLAEARIRQRDFAGAEETLGQLAASGPGPDGEWPRLQLTARLQLLTARAEPALQTSSNLFNVATRLRREDWQADSTRLRIEALEKLDRLTEAIMAARFYETNFAAVLDADGRRRAGFKVVELSLRTNNVAAAAQFLDDYLARHPDDRATDLALLTLGELRLKEHYQNLEIDPLAPAGAAPVSGTNLLQQARTNLNRFVQVFTNSEYLGRAYLDLGWCNWADTNIVECQGAWSNALRWLPPAGEEAAVVRFKLADLQYLQQDFGGAITNYYAVIERYGKLPAVRDSLVEQALYQIVRAGIAESNLPVADTALDRILKEYPNGFLTERGTLLMAQEFTRHKATAHARELLLAFTARWPNSDRMSEARLAIARTYEKDEAWPAAIAEYDRLITGAGTNPPPARAEFSRAWDHYLAGNEERAFGLFTNFVVRWSNHPLAPYAQNWIATHYARAETFSFAERNYETVFNTKPDSELALQARMNAGRMAVQLLNIADASNYFSEVIRNTNSPPDLVQQARFAYGDALKSLASPTNRIYYLDAARIFTNLYNVYATNRVGPQALGRMGDCYNDLAGTETNAELRLLHYAQATNAYQQTLDSPVADVPTRSMAEVGLGKVAERLADLTTNAPARAELLWQARERYLNVIQGTHLREGEKRDLFWVGEAGAAALRVNEQRGDWEQYVKLCDTLQQLLPSLRDQLQKKRARALESARK